MSELRVDSVKSKGGGAPDLPKGVTISGIATAATLGATTVDVSNVNVSGVVTSATLNGPLLSTGTPTLGLGVTINSSGVAISGVATAGIVSATTLYGDGTNITGIAATLAPLFYNPDIGDSAVTFGTGIGITFNQQIKAGTGNITIRETNASGTVVENFGVGSSVTISENRVTFTPTTNLSESTIYHVSYPSGCFTNNEGTDYVGTAYTFKAFGYNYELWMVGKNNAAGGLGQNNKTSYSSPVQVPGNTWRTVNTTGFRTATFATKTDGTLWSWGYNEQGQLGQNEEGTAYSSPVQIPGTTWKNVGANSLYNITATKTDGTMWAWGSNTYGLLAGGVSGAGAGTGGRVSSPIQIPGTTWDRPVAGYATRGGIKTDGTLWVWGRNHIGQLAQNNINSPANHGTSSPVQIPGTTWSDMQGSVDCHIAVKTDGTLWSWGYGVHGEMGHNSPGNTKYSSPVQIPGTTWSIINKGYASSTAVKTDGTLWVWGLNNYGQLGQNNRTSRSSPTQIPGTTWSFISHSDYVYYATKTDNTLWAWGYNPYGKLGQNNRTYYSSPVQIPGTEWISEDGYWGNISQNASEAVAIIKRVTP